MTTSPVTEILVGDASRLRGEALALALAGRGYRVRGAAATREGLLSAVAERPPDVCLVDASLLGDLSVDLIRLLRNSSPDIKIIMVSRRADPRLAEDAVAAGAAGFVRKDQGLDPLDRILRQVVSGEVCVAPAADPEAVRRREEARDRPFRWLTQREREVLRRLTEGDDTVAIARALGMTTNTARTHVQNLLDKLGVHSRLEAVALAHRMSAGERAE